MGLLGPCSSHAKGTAITDDHPRAATDERSESAPPQPPRTVPNRRAAMVAVIIAIVLTIGSLYTLYEGRNVVTPEDQRIRNHPTVLTPSPR